MPATIGESSFRPLLRPLVALTLPGPLAPRLTSWFLVLATAFLLFCLIRRANKTRNETWLWPILGCALFLSHPLNVEVKSQLAGMAHVIPLLLLGVAFLTSPFPWGWLALVAAPGFHEIGFFYLGGYCLTLIADKRHREAAIAGVALVVWGIFLSDAGGNEVSAVNAMANPLVALSFGERLLSRLALAGHATKILFFPVTMSSDYSAGTLPMPSGAGNPLTWLGAFALVALFTRLNQLNGSENKRLIGIVLVSGLLINLQILFTSPTLFTEPAWWPAWFALCLWGFDTLNSRDIKRPFAIVAAVLLGASSVSLFSLSWLRQADWTSHEALARADVAAFPLNGRLHFNLGFAQAQRQDWTGARASFAQSVSLYPNFADGHFRLALVLEQLGETGAAAEHKEKARQLGVRIP